MKYGIDKSFIRDAKNAPKVIQQSLNEIITQIENAVQIADIPKVKKVIRL